jgi:heparan-alpha-glucosaminide N-acetyltransferase
MHDSTSPLANTPPAIAPAESTRLLSLDAHRGFVMLLMVSEGFEIGHLAAHHERSRFWQFLDYQFSHVAWTGCSLWDLIQPSFMFIVGVAMPYSYASRTARGESSANTFLHVMWRALALILLGIFLRSNHSEYTRFTFEDVLTQIGLAYPFVYLMLGRRMALQLLALVAVLVGYWLLFALSPLPDFDPVAAGYPPNWSQFNGFAAHWNQHVNPANAFDQWFLNLFPRPEPFLYNGGGYQTLSFVPSIATILAGVIAGTALRRSTRLGTTCLKIVLVALFCLALGFLLDPAMWPAALQHTSYVITAVGGYPSHLPIWPPDLPEWAIAPVVKKIWSPGWVVFSTGWTLLLLAAFLFVVDICRLRRWAFPLLVVGMNSLAMYVLSHLIRGWISGTYQTHLGQGIFEGTYGPTIESVVVLVTLWLICLWMYRRRIFIRL